MDNPHPTDPRPVFTLHHGGNSATFQKAPMEVAREALIAAAELEEEDGPLRDAIRRFASLLPDRRPVRESPDVLERRERMRRQMAETRELENNWRRIPAERRESMLLQVLGNERLLIREMTSRLNVELLGVEGKGPHGKHRALYESNVRSLVMRMLRSGQLDRTAETFRNKTRYRFFRSSRLDKAFRAEEAD
jgi:hypothetical protein